MQPTQAVLFIVPAELRAISQGNLLLLFGFAPRGVYQSIRVTSLPVGSYPAVSPLPLQI